MCRIHRMDTQRMGIVEKCADLKQAEMNCVKLRLLKNCLFSAYLHRFIGVLTYGYAVRELFEISKKGV